MEWEFGPIPDVTPLIVQVLESAAVAAVMLGLLTLILWAVFS